jgi:hypothetical protein
MIAHRAARPLSSKIRAMDGCGSKRAEILCILPYCERDHRARARATGRLMGVVVDPPRSGQDTHALEQLGRAGRCFTSRNAFVAGDRFDDLVADAVDRIESEPPAPGRSSRSCGRDKQRAGVRGDRPGTDADVAGAGALPLAVASRACGGGCLDTLVELGEPA